MLGKRLRYLRYAKKTVSPAVYRKLSTLRGDEFFTTTEHAIISALHHEYTVLLHEQMKSKENGRDTFFVDVRLPMILGKIKHFSVDYDKREFYKVMKLFSVIKKELASLNRVRIIQKK